MQTQVPLSMKTNTNTSSVMKNASNNSTKNRKNTNASEVVDSRPDLPNSTQLQLQNAASTNGVIAPQVKKNTSTTSSAIPPKHQKANVNPKQQHYEESVQQQVGNNMPSNNNSLTVSSDPAAGLDNVLHTLEQDAGGYLQDIVSNNSANIVLLFMLFSAFSIDAGAMKRSEEIGDDCNLSQWGLNDHIQTVVRPFLCAQLEQQSIQVPTWLSVNDGFTQSF